ncbi:protein AGENET DOMAIN (AGD)-CONTAINING P1-like [Silene latifolia]|uniref:protein AGENET DOMAIN (AGD)-CONTAINING P1-like n=1 Tax=Silene latifolia TaxID=37657 RepID=UPI003D7754E1
MHVKIPPKKMADFQLKKNTKVEIKVDEEGFHGVIFSAKIITPPTKTTKKVLVEYETLLAEDGIKPLREKVDLSQITPTQPKESNNNVVFLLDDIVDAYYNDGWWEGVITQVLGDCKYIVYFKPTNEQFEFNGSDLRLHREWDAGNWIPSFDEETQPTEGMMYCKEENVFSKGSRVEVSSDEEGFEGAWFVASVIEVLGKGKFLVEYKDLTTEDNTQYVREEVDALHIRPCPPNTETVDTFKQYDEVDALYNDGWWVGIISEVLGPSKYKVYFKNTNEEMEFMPEELRKHQDWTNGKWVVASEGLNLTQ